MVEEVKLNLRITHSKLDEEIKADIKACKRDLKLSGIWPTLEEDELIRKAIKLYCRWQHDYNGKGEQYQAAYEALKTALSLSGDYHG